MTPPAARPTIPGAGRLGLLDPDAAERLQQLGWVAEDCIPLLWSLSRAPLPDLALLAIERLREALGDGWAELNQARRLFALLGSSTALGDHLIARPEQWQALRGPLVLPDARTLLERMLESVSAQPEPLPEEADAGAAGPDEAGPDSANFADEPSRLYRAAVTGAAAVPALRNCYRDQLLLIAAADLAAIVENEPVIPYSELVQSLSDLADAALTAALAVAVATVFPDEACLVRLAVIAMGKCGARELNYVSDVDVVFVAEPADNRAARLASEMMRIGSAAFFEVDAALRPEGKRGALVRTLESHVAYYKRWAKTWEFQALLKSRPMTGDLKLGRAYTEALHPMVWTASEREDFVSEVQAMRRRVEELIPSDLRERELKLGTGGLRDVEFAVQLLQMVHGRTDEALHVQATVQALAALAAGGYVGRDDAANLTASYEFLRLLEHRLQLQRLKRTHTLPALDDEEGLRWLARAAHIRPDGRSDAVGVLLGELKRNNLRVRRLHVKLFYRPLLESVTRFEADTLRLTPEAAIRQLSALGYTGPENALNHLRALTSGVSRRGRIQALLLPTLLDWLGETPNPDAGLLAYRRLSEDIGTQHQ
jgi:glutamate-ammonia-ligase adenylyltransferase